MEQSVYALDSTTIDLCLSLFPWARFRRRKAAVKLHTLLDLRGNIPTFVRITDGKTHDVTVLDHLPIMPGAFYVMDRGYVDFLRLYRFKTCSAFFVTRAKRGLDFTRRVRRKVDKTTGLRSDQTIVLAGPKSSRLYPDPLRRVVYYDDENDRRFVFLTNNFDLPAPTIAKLYKCRWQIELFFKWIKQNLHIKSFYGTSDNAVRTQVWIAISVYVLVALVKKELGIERSLGEMMQILSLTLFEKTPIFQAFCDPKPQDPEPPRSNQLNLFDL
jgi:IS4 transposase